MQAVCKLFLMVALGQGISVRLKGDNDGQYL